MNEFEIDMTTALAMDLLRRRMAFTVRNGDQEATMAIASVVDHSSGWSTVRFVPVKVV